MDNAKKAETVDTRPDIGGHPLPWTIIEEDQLVDDDDALIVCFDPDHDKFITGLVVGVNAQAARIAALEAALLQVFRKFDEVTVEAPGEVRDSAKAAYGEVEEIIYNLGLAHRVWGNEGKAEQVTS